MTLPPDRTQQAINEREDARDNIRIALEVIGALTELHNDTTLISLQLEKERRQAIHRSILIVCRELPVIMDKEDVKETELPEEGK